MKANVLVKVVLLVEVEELVVVVDLRVVVVDLRVVDLRVVVVDLRVLVLARNLHKVSAALVFEQHF